MPDHHILFYDYVPDILERRGPHRPEHLERIAAAQADGRLVMAGPFGDPPKGAVFVFAGDAAIPEAFVAADPYVAAGLVVGHRIEPYTIV
jgi:uncharacterized protein